MSVQVGCAEAIRQLWEYLDGGMELRDQAALEEHLIWCRRCCGELALADELRSLLRGQDRAAVPGEVLERLTAFVDGLDEIGSDEGKVSG